MSDITETEVEPLKVEDLDDYCEAAASVVEELGIFLGSHHTELVHCNMQIHGKGIAMDMPIAAQDHAARIHGYKNAYDSFCNAMRGNY